MIELCFVTTQNGRYLCDHSQHSRQMNRRLQIDFDLRITCRPERVQLAASAKRFSRDIQCFTRANSRESLHPAEVTRPGTVISITSAGD